MNIKKLNIKHAFVSMFVVLGLCVGSLVPAGTVSAAPGDQYNYTGARYSDPHICILVHSGVWASWPVATAAAYFDSSGKVDLVVRTEAQGCGTYAWSQIMHIRQSATLDSAFCSKFVASQTLYSHSDHPWNPHYDYVYGIQEGSGTITSPTVTLNANDSSCYSTSTRLANSISQGIGSALGLGRLTFPVSYSSVMATSDYSRARVAWATADDRNAIYYLYVN
jgi:hypothetical protein